MKTITIPCYINDKVVSETSTDRYILDLANRATRYLESNGITSNLIRSVKEEYKKNQETYRHSHELGYYGEFFEPLIEKCDDITGYQNASTAVVFNLAFKERYSLSSIELHSDNYKNTWWEIKFDDADYMLFQLSN